MDKLLKEQYYIPYLAENNQINIKVITNIFLNNVFRYYNLFNLIILNKGP